jgi:hypothetical protein
VAALDGLLGANRCIALALLPMVRLQRLVAPAERMCRAIPLPSAALRTGPIALWPALPDVAEVLGRIGTVVAAPTEELLEPLWATTALMAPFYEQLNQVTGWLVTNGVPVEIAAGYTTRLYAAWKVATGHTDDLAALRARGRGGSTAGSAAGEAITPQPRNSTRRRAAPTTAKYRRVQKCPTRWRRYLGFGRCGSRAARSSASRTNW